MKKLNLIVFLLAVMCLTLLFVACDTAAPAPVDPCAQGHTPITEKAVKPTCTTQGLSEGSRCSVCHKVLVAQEVIPAYGHEVGEWTVQYEPTCAGKGSQYNTCTVCDQVVDIVAIDELGHTFDDWRVLKNASCSSVGEREHTCTVCEYVEKETLPLIAHTPSNWITDVNATCQASGCRHQSCVFCSQIITVELIPQKEHTFDDWKVLSTSSCSKQGERGHVCTTCGTGERELLPLAEHVPGEWVTDLLPTCSSKGSRHQSCVNCDAIISVEQAPATTHTASSSWTIITVPTATANGQSALCCVTCGTPMQTCATTLTHGIVSLTQTASLSFSGYVITYPTGKNANTYFVDRLSALSGAIQTASGHALAIRPDAATSAKEILIGLTSREESQSAYESITGNGFTISVKGDKIVIVGSDDTLTLMALQYFINTYLSSKITSLTLSTFSTSQHLSDVTLLAVNGSPFTYVLDADVDADPQHMYVGDSYSINNNGYAGDSRDYPAYLFEAFVTHLAQVSGFGVSDFNAVVDTNKTYLNGFEVLFGDVDRAETRAFLAELDANQYGFYITGNKIVITAHTDEGLERASKEFLSFFDFVYACNGGVFPQGYRFVGSMTDQGWIMDFPRPENATLINAVNANDSSLQMVYTGNGATSAGYLAYCQTLEKAGYIAVMQNDNAADLGSYFRIYRNVSKGHVLYVAYNAFSTEEDYASTYAAEEKAGTAIGDFVHTNTVNSKALHYDLHDYEQCIRIVTIPYAKAYLPTTELMNDSYNRTTQKVCESSVTAVRYVGSSVGMCYILTLEDGSFIIVDGGNNIADNCDKQILYATLKELHKKAYGEYPTTSNPIHIKAWFITHSHGDHYANMNAMLSSYASEKLIKMDYLIGNFPEKYSTYPVSSDICWMGTESNIAKLQGYFTSAGLSAFQYVKLRTGMTVYFANLKMEILMTYEDHAPYRITNSNDTNTVTKWTIRSANKDTTWTMLGDSCIYQSRWLCAMWGGRYNTSTKLYDNSYLKADMLQLAHHGNIGCEIALYKSIQPEIVFFPHQSGSYNSYTQDSGTNWADVVDRFVINELSTVKYIVVSGMNSTSSSYTDSVTISFTADGISLPSSNPAWGIKYNKSTGAVTTANISYNSLSWTDTLQGRKSTYCKNSPVIKK